MSSSSTPQAPVVILGKEKEIVDTIRSGLGDKGTIIYARPKRIKVQAEASSLLEVATYLKDKLGMEIAASVAGTDIPKDNVIEVVYHLISVTDDSLLRIVVGLSCRVPRDSPKVPTLISVFPSANFHERETHEMLGVVFEGHPNLEKLLLPEDWADIPPLRKEYHLPGR
jgi:NADH-quinone oxidoreductase subunit C